MSIPGASALKLQLSRLYTTTTTSSRLVALTTQLLSAPRSATRRRQQSLSSTPTLSTRQIMSSSSIPSTMRAMVVSKNGGPETMELDKSYPVPKPAAGELLVKNTFAGINYIDTYFRSGLYPSTLPLILGQEASGTVAALGEGDNPLGFKVGDRVVWMKGGAYAEYSAIPAAKTYKIPDGVGDEDAVGGFLMGMTALSLVREGYPVKKGDWVLLHAAAGGVGLLMCQILKSLGAKTIATAGGPEKCALAKANGADYLIDYKTLSPDGKTWLDKVLEISSSNLNGEGGVDVVFDSVGKDTWESSLQAVRRKGAVVFFGNASGPVPPFPVQRLAAKNISVKRTTLMQYTYTREEFEAYAGEVLKMIGDGGLKVRRHKVYGLEDVRVAHEDLEARRTMGKLLLRL